MWDSGTTLELNKYAVSPYGLHQENRFIVTLEKGGVKYFLDVTEELLAHGISYDCEQVSLEKSLPENIEASFNNYIDGRFMIKPSSMEEWMANFQARFV